MVPFSFLKNIFMKNAKLLYLSKLVVLQQQKMKWKVYFHLPGILSIYPDSFTEIWQVF